MTINLITKMGKQKRRDKNVQQQPLLELVMIVKNSGEDIVPMLLSVIPYIDHWTILDTGSQDGTQEKILAIMDTSKGKLYEEPFVDFATSRNRALELAGDRCEFAICLDDTYHLVNGDNLRKELRAKNSNKTSGFRILIQTGEELYPSPRIFRTKHNVKYKHRIHELPYPPEGTEFSAVNTCQIDDKASNYMKQRSKERLPKDIPILKEELENDPDNRRLLFHLGRTYIVIGDLTLGKETMEKIVEQNIHDEHEFEARLIIYAIKTADLSFEDIAKETYDDNIEYLKKLAEDFPKRAEPPYYLAFLYRSTFQNKEAFNWIMKAAALEPTGSVTIKKRIYQTEIPYLTADIALVAGQTKIAEKVLKTYAGKNGDNRLINMVYSVSNIQQPPGKTVGPPLIAIHATDNVRGWNPDNMKRPAEGHVKCSGSEFMAMNLGREFAKMGYAVVMFGKFVSEGYNFEGTFDGVQYIDSDRYWDFLTEYKTDILIASRDVQNLVYNNNVKKAYLWLHDTVPVSDNAGATSIQYHKEKFKRVICLCDWHSKNISRKYHVPKRQIYVSRNSIDTDRFLKEGIDKIPLRCIYASAPERGLKYLLQMIPKLHAVFPDITLYIFADLQPDKLESHRDMENIIKELPYVFNPGRVSQEKIAEEFLRSDIFLYPTDFAETFCIAALEAQAAGLLCACPNLAALGEIVGERGILSGKDIRQAETQQELLDKLIDVLKSPDKKRELQQKSKEWAMEKSHAKLAYEWRRDLFKL